MKKTIQSGKQESRKKKKGSQSLEFPGPQGSCFPNSFSSFPNGQTDFENWGPITFQGPFRALVLSDLHIPYHDRRALICAIDYGLQHDANLILLNGDIIDFYALSFWQKDPRKRDAPREIKLLRKFIGILRETFPRADLVYKLGNHEDRWERYLIDKAPELLGVPEFDIREVLGIREKELIRNYEPIQLGNLNVVHGHEYRFAISNPVNPARGLFLKAKAMAMCGHFHQSSQHTERAVDGSNLATWSTGCLCDLHPAYRPLNNWNHGFSFVTVHKSGKFEVENKYVSNGKVY